MPVDRHGSLQRFLDFIQTVLRVVLELHQTGPENVKVRVARQGL
jgi:hypothetical protein